MEKLYYNGDIITMEQEQDCPQALLVRDGIIAGIGSLEDLAAQCSNEVERVDLKGHTLMPSFLDGHSHITVMMQLSQSADLSDCESFDDIISVMQEYIRNKRIPAGTPVMGCGYDHNILQEERHPDKEVLDRISTEHPIYISHASGHMGCVNSRMLQLIDITAETPDIEGGLIGRVEGSREPSGYLEEGGMVLLRRALGDLGKDLDYDKLLKDAQMAYLSNGITTVQDGATEENMLGLLYQAAKEGRLKVDVVSYPLLSDGGGELMQQYRDCAEGYYNRFRLGGYKLLLDGSPQGRSAWMTEPYEGEESYRGYPWMPREETQEYIQQAIDENRQLLVHCNGDAAADEYLHCYQRALERSKNPDKQKLRPVMIHCQTVRDDQLDKMAELSMIPSIFVAHVYYWGDVHVKNLGKKRGNHISPVKAAIERGLCVNFHQDAPVVKPLMLHTIWTAVNRISRKKNVIGADQRVSVYEALKAVTINTAYMYGEEDRKGSLRMGKLADLVVLSKNPLKTEPMFIRDIQVLETIKEGKTLYQKENQS